MAYNLAVDLYKDARKNAGAGWTVLELVHMAFDTSTSPAVALVQLQGMVTIAQSHAASGWLASGIDYMNDAITCAQIKSARRYTHARDMLDILVELEAELRGE